MGLEAFTGLKTRIFKHLILIGFGWILAGCGDRSAVTKSGGSSTNAGGTAQQTQSDEAYQREKEAILQHAEQFRDRSIRNPLQETLPLPNPPTGSGLPRPIAVNFYQVYREYPGYLLCLYEVDEIPYRSNDEVKWFTNSLVQIRSQGKARFPKFEWVAVAIFNRADYQGVNTFERCFKVGAIFRADDVFDPGHDFIAVMNTAHMDREPFKYEAANNLQQRWLVVVRNLSKAPR
jgi:hypothetical protein